MSLIKFSWGEKAGICYSSSFIVRTESLPTLDFVFCHRLLYSRKMSFILAILIAVFIKTTNKHEPLQWHFVLQRSCSVLHSARFCLLCSCEKYLIQPVSNHTGFTGWAWGRAWVRPSSAMVRATAWPWGPYQGVQPLLHTELHFSQILSVLISFNFWFIYSQLLPRIFNLDQILTFWRPNYQSNRKAYINCQ